MSVSTVGIEEVRASVDAAIETLQESLRQVNHEVSCNFQKSVSFCSRSPGETNRWTHLDLVEPRARL